MQVLKHILSLQPPRLHDRQDAFHEPAPLLAPTAKAALAPQDGPTHQPPNIPLQMRPPNLPTVTCHAVGYPPPVTAPHALKGFTQQGGQPRRATSGVDHEDRDGLRRGSPQPPQGPSQLPTGLIDMLD